MRNFRYFSPHSGHICTRYAWLNFCSIVAKDSSVRFQTGFYEELWLSSWCKTQSWKDSLQSTIFELLFFLATCCRYQINNRNHSGFWERGQVSPRASLISLRNLTRRVASWWGCVIQCKWRKKMKDGESSVIWGVEYLCREWVSLLMDSLRESGFPADQTGLMKFEISS